MQRLCVQKGKSGNVPGAKGCWAKKKKLWELARLPEALFTLLADQNRPTTCEKFLDKKNSKIIYQLMDECRLMYDQTFHEKYSKYEHLHTVQSFQYFLLFPQ